MFIIGFDDHQGLWNIFQIEPLQMIAFNSISKSQLAGRIARKKKRTKHLGASKWTNQVLVINKTSNEKFFLEEKCKNVSNKKLDLSI